MNLTIVKSHILLSAFFIVNLYTVIGQALVPSMPQEPASEEAFSIVKDYYQIARGLPSYQVKSIQTQDKTNYELQYVQIGVADYPDVKMTLKLPKIRKEPMSAIVLFTGFQTGDQAVNLVGDSGDSVIVGFQYPWPVSIANGVVTWNWERMESIPILMAVGLAWLNHQPMINPHKINVVAVSFGTLFYPLAQRILNAYGIYSKTAVFGYGGVDIPEVIGNELAKTIGGRETEFAKSLVRIQTWFVEPKYHLSHLQGPFLIVQGEDDTVFPNLSKQGLSDGLRGFRKTVILPGAHIQPDRPEIIKSFMEQVAIFLKEHQAI
jgi:hypothetical protein